MNLYLAMERELLVVSPQNGTWKGESQLAGMQTTCLAIDPFRPEHIYCGTFGRGLWCSDDEGHTWRPIGDPGITHSQITSVAVSPTERSGNYGVVYAGTEPTALFRSEDGGDTWRELKTLRELPSAPTWSFPPRPYTSHARWITPDVLVPGRIFLAIEAGALVRSLDGGEHWEDRKPDGPFDTHTLVMHPLAPNRLYSAAGDGFMSQGRGYNESADGGETWQRPDDGLQHHYLWSVAVDSADPDTIIISASSSPAAAHSPNANAYSALYRKQRGAPWHRVTEGLPEAQGMTAPVLVTSKTEPGVFYAFTNKGLYRSSDTGQSWERLPIPWSPDYEHQRPQALAVREG